MRGRIRVVFFRVNDGSQVYIGTNCRMKGPHNITLGNWLYVGDRCKDVDMVANGSKAGVVYNVGGLNECPNIFIVKTSIE